jgi:hypothetical protein
MPPKKYQPTTFSPSLFRRSLSGAGLTHLQHRLLTELCEHSQIDKPTVKVSNARLAHHCECTEEAVRQNLNRLQSAGFVQSVGKRQGGNQGANRWRLIYTGMRNRSDTGQPTWDAQGWDRDVFVDSPACHGCGAAQPPTPVGQPPTQPGQPPTQTPSTPNADTLNPQPGLGLSSKEADVVCFADYEVDAYASGATPPPDGGAPRPGDAPPVGVEVEESTPIGWEDWAAQEGLPEKFPMRCCQKHLDGGGEACGACRELNLLADRWKQENREWKAYDRESMMLPRPMYDDPGLKIYDWQEWWSERRVDDRIPLTRPGNTCGRNTHKDKPAPGCSPCAKAAAAATLWQQAHDQWDADCADKRQAIGDCGDCDVEGYQFDEDGNPRWCDHAAAKAAAIEKLRAKAIANRNATSNGRRSATTTSTDSPTTRKPPGKPTGARIG